MKKRLLALVLTITLLAGCASTPASSPSPATPSASGASSASQNETALDPASKEGRAARNAAVFDKIQPLSDTPVTFKVVATTQPNQISFGDMQIFKELEKRTNVHIEWENYLGVSYGDQKNLMLSTNNLPDAFFGYGSLTTDDINKYGPMGMFMPLDELMDKHSPNYKARLAENELLSGMSTALDGKRYAYGTVIETDVRNFPDNLYINKTWLDALNLPVPTTMDEYYNALGAFKLNDCNGNGDKNDEVPYTFTKFNHITGYGSFFGAWGRVDVHNGSSVTALDHFVVDDSGKVVFTADKPEYKEAIKGLSRFFKERLFDQEGLVQEQSQYQAKMQSQTPIVGSFYAWDANAVGIDNASQYVAITPIKATADAQPAHVKMRRNHINVQATGFTITSKTANPEILAKWIDLFYDLDMSIMVHQGPEYVVPQGNGNYIYDETPDKDGQDFLMQMQYNSPYDSAPCYLPVAIQGTKIPYNPSDKIKLEVINNIYRKQPIDMTLPNMNFTEAEVKLNTSIGMDIQNYVKEKQSKWLLGEEDVEAGWDSYIKQLNTFKLEQYVASLQGSYDRATA